jgi:transcription-repair coupling factor (superfamily II helicase)
LKGEKVKLRVEVRIALDFLGTGDSSLITHHSSLPPNYVTEPQHRIEIYRKLAQATDKPALDSLQKELRDRFGPLPSPVELLLAVGELKILASEKAVTAIEVEEDKLKITRHNNFIQLGGKFPRLTKKEAKARLKEIKRLLLAL